MKRDYQGHYVTISSTGERAKAFVPAPLPPKPPILWSSDLRHKFDQALLALGRLDSISGLLPDSALFLYMYVRKEAVLSSMIEGTQSSISDLLLYEMEQVPGVPLDDVQEVSNYVAALDCGLKLLESGLPISLRLMREVHHVLLSGGRGKTKSPGEFRHSQNWIGGTRPGNARFVPPPPEQVMPCLGDLEKFIHDQPEATPVLLKAALAHVQFETIHPFLDGNGRLGRLLITLLLCEQGVLQKPMLYLSLYFKTHRQHYYNLLDRVRIAGEWEAWLDFFADAVWETASGAVETAKSLLAVSDRDRDRIAHLGRAAKSALQVHRVLMERPLATASWVVEATGLTPATVNKALRHLEQIGVVRELTEKKRNRLFCYSEYVEIMGDGTSPF